ncbi:type II CRISPR RNA-guided endonuclease Cas9 [Secundilactobacillus oryzae]|nr:type II CRISPR RNA-guided endonuclease Cas9 [Secundilactobacillus oryzae]
MKEYSIGLDIGSSSVGFVAVDDQYRVVRAKGKNVIGTRLFDEGKTAADRRGLRTTRRRLSRRKWRLRLLRGIFEPHINEIDESFFMRLKESNISPKDSNKHFPGDILFNDRSDREFYENYPTIYHLRQALKTEKRQFDIREIYLAMHHIVKYRGHFLEGGTVTDFEVGELDLAGKFSRLNELFESINLEVPFVLRLDNLEDVKAVLIDSQRSAQDRQRTLTPDIYVPSTDKITEKRFKGIATELLKAIVGNKAKFDVLAGLELDKEEAKLWALTFDSETFDEDIEQLEGDMTEATQDLIEILKSLRSLIRLAVNMPEGVSLSEMMIQRYEDHADHLKLLRDIIHNTDAEKAAGLQAAYDGYIDGVKGKKTPVDDFYKAIKKNLDDSEAAHQILALIDKNEFMPKQRSKSNGWIPHQIQQKELDRIIENQKQYYPWLADVNPNESRRKVAPYKIDELVTFRVPYYVGPLVTSEEQKKYGSKFAWMVRKEEKGEITPWNFDQKVDRAASATEFINRMTTMDTYLLNEDVLPAHSLIYQKYEVLNELNKVKINGDAITPELKQKIYHDLFEKQTTVSIKNLQTYLVSESEASEVPEIKGLADEKKFLSGLTTYHDLMKIFDRNVVNDPERAEDFEKIIRWSTVFEDKHIYREKLDSLSWLTTDQKDRLAVKRYRGWGRLSEKLLIGLRDEGHRSIMDYLWETTSNFMQIQAQNDFSEKIAAENKEFLDNTQSVQGIINELYTSPQNKKAIRQTLLVVEDIKKAFHGEAPKRIFVEFARENESTPQRSIQRQRQVENAYEKVTQNLLVDDKIRAELKDSINEKRLFHDRLFLYFMQGGIDMYSGKKINIDNLSAYDIDHILPQSFTVDNSLDNRVLTNQKDNREKGNSLPSELYRGSMKETWEMMRNQGLLSKGKFHRLMMTPNSMTAYDQQGFINRQLVETRQVIKLAVEILASEFDQADEKVEIVSVKAGLTHQMRQDFSLIKNRDVNDYHHAFDAYLTAFVGTYLLKRYPKLRPYFVYGEFKKFSQKQANLTNFNFLWALKHKDQVAVEDTGEKIWNKPQDLAYIRHLFAFKKILISREVSERHGALFDQTLYKASDDKASGQGSKKLIPAKDNRPTELYGGYSGQTSAFMAIVKVTKGKKTKYLVVGVPTAAISQLQGMDVKSSQYTEKIYNILSPKLLSKNDDFEVIVPKVRYRQLILDNNQLFTLGSDTYKYNARQLVLSNEVLAVINRDKSFIDKKLSEEAENQALNDAFDEIVVAMDKHFDLYDKNGFREKVKAGKQRFEELPVSLFSEDKENEGITKRTVLKRILQGLHANATTSDLKVLDGKFYN